MLNKRKHRAPEKAKPPKEPENKKNKSKDVTVNPTTPTLAKPPLWKHFVRRIFIIGLAFVAAYISSYRGGDGTQNLAQSAEIIARRSFEVPCSQDYILEKEIWQQCIPKRCGRVLTDSLIPYEDVEKMLKMAKKGFKLGGSSGGASILDLHSGALSKDDVFIDVYRLPQAKRLFTQDDLSVYRRVKQAIQMRIMAEFGASHDHVYLTHPTFFSRITNKPAKTIHDEYWHPHIDKNTYGTFHYTSLLYLNTHGEHYEGGRFIFVDRDANRTVEPRQGRVSLFTSGSENIHYVEKVTSGERYAVTISFTCNSSAAIQEPDFGL